MTRPPVLWHFPISHYNEKARWALDWKGIPHVRRALAMSYVPRALWTTGQAKLPISLTRPTASRSVAIRCHRAWQRWALTCPYGQHWSPMRLVDFFVRFGTWVRKAR